MAGTMICTRCHSDTGIDPDFTDLPVEVVIDFCRHWRCSECLDEEERLDLLQKREGG